MKNKLFIGNGTIYSVTILLNIECILLMNSRVAYVRLLTIHNKNQNSPFQIISGNLTDGQF